MDPFEEFCNELAGDELGEMLFREIDRINERDQNTEPVDDFVERIYRQNEDRHRNPLKPPLPGN